MNFNKPNPNYVSAPYETYYAFFGMNKQEQNPEQNKQEQYINEKSLIILMQDIEESVNLDLRITGYEYNKILDSFSTIFKIKDKKKDAILRKCAQLLKDNKSLIKENNELIDKLKDLELNFMTTCKQRDNLKEEVERLNELLSPKVKK